MGRSKEMKMQRIKDDEDIHEQDTREPDIPVAAALPPLPLEEKAAPMQAQAPIIVPAKIPTTTTTHVKTPDEVEDLPEHEAVDQIRSCKNRKILLRIWKFLLLNLMQLLKLPRWKSCHQQKKRKLRWTCKKRRRV